MSTSPLLRILLLIPHLGGGGAEHVIAQLARHLDCNKYEIHLGLVTETGFCDYCIPPWVTIHRLEAKRVRHSLWKLLRLVWYVRPAIVLSGIAHLNLLVLWLRPVLPPGINLLVRQNGSPSAMSAATWPPSLSRFLYGTAYRMADGIICQTFSMADELQNELSVELPHVFTLPNPVDTEGIRSAVEHTKCRWTGSGPNLLAVGRLVPEKGFDLLITAFAKIHGRYPDAELVIAGSGPCEQSLRSQCKTLALEDHVRILGRIPSPAAYFGGATAFVLSSRDEGLPNALLEAAAAGLPIGALPASRGVADLLRDKPGVWLGAEVSASELEHILCEALASIDPGQRFSHGWVQAFDCKVAVRAYEDVIDRALQERLR